MSGGDQAFTFIGNAGFHHIKGELHYVQKGCHTIVEGDDTTQVSATADPTDPAALMQRDAVWELPSTPGTYELWLVVRDGHAGEAACHTTIEVTAIAATAP